MPTCHVLLSNPCIIEQYRKSRKVYYSSFAYIAGIVRRWVCTYIVGTYLRLNAMSHICPSCHRRDNGCLECGRTRGRFAGKPPSGLASLFLPINGKVVQCVTPPSTVSSTQRGASHSKHTIQFCSKLVALHFIL